MRALAPLALVLLAALPVAAEHEIWYRYTVLGYVTDAGGRPRAGQRRELMRARTGFSYLGETTARVRASFDPTNHSDERGTRVDFTGARVDERAAAFRATLANFIGATRR